jgi:uncharacterized membrane protein YtjA (UPF0391 family)
MRATARHHWSAITDTLSQGSSFVGIQSAVTSAEVEMLYYALVFFVIAIVAAILGFGGVSIAFAGIAKILFVLFLIAFCISLVMHVGRRA